MSPRPPFRNIEPAFFSGLLDDPVLNVHIRPLGRGILIDCGRIHHLAKRVLKSISALFISHAHMDHFMGIDTFIRSTHVSPRTVDIFGPPGLADKIACKLAGYDWNLTEPYWCSLRVHEIFADRIATSLFSGPDGFERQAGEESTRTDRVIYRDRYLRVEAEACDHKIPTLMFRVTELPSFQVDEAKIGVEGLVRGPWLRDLRRLFARRELTGGPLKVLRRRGETIVEEEVGDAARLYESIRGERLPAAIGYATDIAFSEENVGKVMGLMHGVTLLICECSFLKADLDKARVSAHLCTSDVNYLLERLRPPFFLPMHLSKSYIHHWERLYEELEIPSGVTLVRLPKYLTARPILACEAVKPGLSRPELVRT
jgi:ribonuclease Z